MSTPSAVNQHMLQKKNIHRATACYNNHHLWRENASHIKHTWCLCLELHICCSVTQSCLTLCKPKGVPCPSPSARACSNSRPLSWWCHPTILSSVILFSSCFQSYPASGTFPMSQLFPKGGQIIRASASASVHPMNIQDWYPSGWIGLISLQSKGLSRVFSNTTIQKHQFFGTQLSSQSNSHIHTWSLEKP